jgi:hypothetical protein
MQKIIQKKINLIQRNKIQIQKYKFTFKKIYKYTVIKFSKV